MAGTFGWADRQTQPKKILTTALQRAANSNYEKLYQNGLLDDVVSRSKFSAPLLWKEKFWERLQVKGPAYSSPAGRSFSHPLSSSHFRQHFNSSSGGDHHTRNGFRYSFVVKVHTTIKPFSLYIILIFH